MERTSATKATAVATSVLSGPSNFPRFRQPPPTLRCPVSLLLLPRRLSIFRSPPKSLLFLHLPSPSAFPFASSRNAAHLTFSPPSFRRLARPHIYTPISSLRVSRSLGGTMVVMSSMAGMRESVALPSPGVRPSLRPAAVASSPAAVSLSSPRRKAGALPGFVGLRIQSRPLATSNSKSLRAPRCSRNGRVVCEAQDTALDLPPVTDTTWKSLVLKADGPVLVEFWAPWCGPCRMLHPVVGELADEYAGKLKCFKLNTDESPSIATQYGVRSVPTIMIFSNGEKKDSVLGAVPKTTLATCIEKFL